MNLSDRLMAIERKGADEIQRLDHESGNTNPLLLMVPAGNDPAFRIDLAPDARFPGYSERWAHPSLNPQTWICRSAFRAAGRDVRMLIPEAFARLIATEARQRQADDERVYLYLTAIEALTAELTYPPAIRDIGERVGRSASRVKAALDWLNRIGYIDRIDHRPRTLTITAAGRQYLAEHPEEVA